jgi:hypothetical protein
MSFGSRYSARQTTDTIFTIVGAAFGAIFGALDLQTQAFHSRQGSLQKYNLELEPLKGLKLYQRGQRGLLPCCRADLMQESMD